MRDAQLTSALSSNSNTVLGELPKRLHDRQDRP